MRSLLFVPADNERKLDKAANAGADALLLDLEDSVVPERKAIGRTLLRKWLAEQPEHARLWVRVNDLASGELLQDLGCVVPARPAGIMLPKIRGPEDLVAVGHYLDMLEVEHGLTPGGTRIIALVTETPAGLLRIGEMVGQAHPRISHVSWGAEDLSAALGARDPRDAAGTWRPTYEYARSQCLLAAHALGVEALDTVYVNFRDLEGLRRSCQAARTDGFTGGIAIHPHQVPILNEAFTPTGAEKEFARRLVAAFASGAGAVAVDGKMYDAPHLKAARRLLGNS